MKRINRTASWAGAGAQTSVLRALILLGAWAALSAAPAWAQDSTQGGGTRGPVVIEHADRLEGGIVGGEEVQRLIGNVALRQEETRLTAREAIHYASRGEYEFFGDVKIVDEGDTLWADHVVYDANLKVGRASPDVRLSDGDVTLLAPSGIYFVDEKRAELEGGVTMVDSTATLTSRRGSYWMDEKRAEFYESVRLVEEESTVEADSVTYFRETEISLAYGNVAVEHRGGEPDEAEADTLSRTLLFGHEVYNDNKAGFSRVKGDPLLVRLEEDSTGAPTDTLLIRAVVLESTRKDSLDRLVAVDSVRIWRGDMSAVADSAVSDRVTLAADTSGTLDEIRLFRQPVVWYQEMQVFGDTIFARGRSGTVDSLFVNGDAFVAQLDTATARIRQMRGGTLLGLFVADSLRTIIVEPNAEVIDFKRNEDGGVDATQVSADRARFSFRNDEVESLRFFGNPEGTLYPDGLIPEPLQLEGYRWEPERRPAKKKLIQRNGRTLPAAIETPAITTAEGS